MAKPSVLVSRRWPAAVEATIADRFEAEFNRADRPLTPAEFREAIARYDAVLPTVTDFLGREALDTPKPAARIIGNYGVGISQIDVDSAKDMGIALERT